MGTEFHGLCNSSTYFQKIDDGLTAIRSSTSETKARLQDISSKAGFSSAHNRLEESMGRFLDHYNRDYIKNTMLNHEEIFHHQVQELHRLYHVQKMLMAELKRKEIKLQCHANTSPLMIRDTKTRHWSNVSTSETDSSSYISNADQSNVLNLGLSLVHPSIAVAGPSSRDISSDYSEDYQIIQKGLNLEQPAEEYGNWKSRTIQNQTNIYKKQPKENAQIESKKLSSQVETDIELTLSIGCGTDKG